MTRKPNGYWTLEKILNKTRKIVEREGYLPRKKLGYDLINSIKRNGGFSKIYKLLELDGKKPNGYFSNMTEEQWLEYGKENKYDKLSRGELRKKSGYYQIGLKKNWIAKLIPETKQKPNGFFKDMTKEEWLAYGRERGLDKLGRKELRKEGQYYNIGIEKGWISELIPETKHKPHGFYSNMTKEEWLGHGKQNELYNLSRAELEKKSSRYYTIGLTKEWLDDLIPAKQHSLEQQLIAYGGK